MNELKRISESKFSVLYVYRNSKRSYTEVVNEILRSASKI